MTSVIASSAPAAIGPVKRFKRAGEAEQDAELDFFGVTTRQAAAATSAAAAEARSSFFIVFLPCWNISSRPTLAVLSTKEKQF